MWYYHTEDVLSFHTSYDETNGQEINFFSFINVKKQSETSQFLPLSFNLQFQALESK